MRYKLVLLFLILFSITVSAVITRECLDRVKPNMNCSVIFNPYSNLVDCSNFGYDLVNATRGNGAIIITDRPLVNLTASLGICYSTFNQTEGDYVMVHNITNETNIIVVDGNTNDQIITEVDSVEENQATISSYIGDPSGNSTSLWDYMYCDTVNFNNINTCLFYRMWVSYPWRTTSGIRT